MPEGIRELLHSTSKGIRRAEGGALIPPGLRAIGVSSPVPLCGQSLCEIWVGLSRLRSP